MARSTMFDLAADKRSPQQVRIPHGTECECVALAAALGLEPGAISFYYCRNMLQRRWSMRCKHGELDLTSGPPPAGERWKDKGQMTPVLAILVSNA
jgi:hypothetical protein